MGLMRTKTTFFTVCKNTARNKYASKWPTTELTRRPRWIRLSQMISVAAELVVNASFELLGL